jgi:hypothetical protein
MINSESPTTKMRRHSAPGSITFQATSAWRAARIRADVATEFEFFAGGVLLQPRRKACETAAGNSAESARVHRCRFTTASAPAICGAKLFCDRLHAWRCVDMVHPHGLQKGSYESTMRIVNAMWGDPHAGRLDYRRASPNGLIGRAPMPGLRLNRRHTSVLKAVTLVSQFRNSASAKPGKWHPVDAEMSEDGELACHHECASEAREAA